MEPHGRRLNDENSGKCLANYTLSLAEEDEDNDPPGGGFGWPECAAIALGGFVGLLAVYEIVQEKEHGIEVFAWKSGARVAFTMALDSYQLILATATAAEQAMTDNGSSLLGGGAMDTVFLAFSALSTTVAFVGILAGIYVVVTDSDFDFDADWASSDGIAGVW